MWPFSAHQTAIYLTEILISQTWWHLEIVQIVRLDVRLVWRKANIPIRRCYAEAHQEEHDHTADEGDNLEETNKKMNERQRKES